MYTGKKSASPDTQVVVSIRVSVQFVYGNLQECFKVLAKLVRSEVA